MPFRLHAWLSGFLVAVSCSITPLMAGAATVDTTLNADPIRFVVPAKNETREHFHYLSDEEDWKALCTPASHKQDPMDSLKCIPLAADPNRYLTLGGDIRFRTEHYFNHYWNSASGSSGYLLHRDRIHADLHEDRLRSFVELEHASDSGGPTDPLTRDDLAATSAYVEYGFGGATSTFVHPLAIRVGRQQLAYGSHRMIDNRAGTNTVQAFDGIRARFTNKKWQEDLFVTRPVVVGPYIFDDPPAQKNSLSGIYATHTGKRAVVDLYWLIDQRANEMSLRGVQPAVRDTLGMRYGHTGPHIDSDVELAHQLGSVAGARIDAYEVATNFGYSWKRRLNAYRIGLGAGISSGDHGSHGATDTQFRPAYPTGLIFGVMQANGDINAGGFAPSFTYTYHDKITASAKDYFYYRMSTEDGLYTAGGILLRQANGSTAVPIGNLASLSVNDAFNNHIALSVTYARYYIGAFLKAVGPTPQISSADTALFVTALQYQF